MTQKYIFLLLFVCGALVLGVWWFDTNTTNPNEPQDMPPRNGSTTTDPGENGSDTRAGWQQFERVPMDGVTFSISVPERAEIQAVRDTIYEIKYIGPESEPNTEITDGYYISLQFVSDALLDTYAANEAVVGEVSETTFLDRAAVRYQTESALGNQVIDHVVIGLADEEMGVLDISYQTYADTAGEYVSEVQQIIESITIETTETANAEQNELITITTPQPGATVTSPLRLAGEARGQWFFEATAPVTVVNWDGLIIGEGYIEAEGEWMTEEFVPFSGTVTYELASDVPYRRGTVIFNRANPSGLPANDAAVEIPVQFAR